MAYQNDFVLGDTKACCDVCGFDYKGSQLKKRWDGAMVCAEDWEPRHPQDTIKIRPERNNVENPRPRPEIVYI